MGLLEALSGAFEILLDPLTLTAAVVGGIIGYIVGAVPGLNSANVVAILLPLIVVAPTAPALAFISGVYGAAETGSALPAILFNVPGTPGAGPTAIEGHPLARNGRGAEAITVAVVISAVGAIVGGVLAVGTLHYGGRLALRIGPAEMFAFATLGIVGTASLTSIGRPSRGIMSAAIGSLVGLAGSHEVLVLSRATFGVPALYDGFSLIAVVLGVFGVAEGLARLTDPSPDTSGFALADLSEALRIRTLVAVGGRALRTITSYPRALTVAAVVGLIFGLIPGVGVVAAAYVSYGYARTFSKRPEEFGQGSMEGLAAAEMGNNTVVPAALIPLFVLGIPGSVVAGLALAVMLIQGLAPGPAFVQEFEAMGMAIIMAGMVGVLAAATVGFVFSGVLSRLASLPTAPFVTTIFTVSVLGAFSERQVFFDMGVVVVFGILGWLMNRAAWPLAPFLIGFLLVSLAEQALLRVNLLGGMGYIVERPVSLVVLAVSGVLLVLPPLLTKRRLSQRATPAA